MNAYVTATLSKEPFEGWATMKAKIAMVVKMSVDYDLGLMRVRATGGYLKNGPCLPEGTFLSVRRCRLTSG